MDRQSLLSPNMAGSRNKQTTYLHPSLQTTRTMLRQSTGSKDLIIRMLAEVFMVGPDEEGQVRWQQVSSSLVPVSLYSRSTRKWLDYLLSASSMAGANDPANAMSPDSRDFLLLLQQFHQQQKSLSSISKQQQQQDFIVFQIVGHDFINGQCKKILNIKIAQPGTRLGRASDYFVYWKEQPTCCSNPEHQDQRLQRNFTRMQQLSTSIASSNFMLSPNTNRHQQQQADISPVSQHHHRHHGTCWGRSQTWGLNFASINDAKLFYDICSLNLVDLDFNSDYLKQNIISDRHLQSVINQNASAGSLLLNQRGQQQAKQQQLSFLQDCPFPRQTATKAGLPKRNSVKRQSSTSKCPSCKQTVKAVRLDSSQHRNASNFLTTSEMCPVHGHDLTVDPMRVRSRSTTRHPGRPSSGLSGMQDKRMRSYSTPASPENECPVHRRRHRMETDCEGQQEQQEVHRNRCSSYALRNNVVETAAQERPRKPARGLLRTSLVGEQSFQQQGSLSKQASKIKYVGHSTSNVSVNCHDNEINNNNNLLESQQNDPKGQYLDGDHFHSSKQQQLPANVIATTRPNVSGYRSSFSSHHTQGAPAMTHFEADNLVGQHGFKESGQFDSIAYRDARLARARYANSRDLKEFLSLDASCLQNNTPKGQRLRMKPDDQASYSSRMVAGHRGKPESMRQTRSQTSSSKLFVGGGKQVQKQQQSKGGKIKERNYSSDTDRPAKSITNNNGNNNRQGQSAARNNRDVAKLASLESNNNGESNNPVRTVSTTTDDLPLDPQTRKRMLKLTSDEVISERTEPQSCAGPPTTDQQQHQPLKLLSHSNDNIDKRLAGRNGGDDGARIRDDKIDRQARAVSLGPELDGSGGSGASKLRGQAARSDVGRRRSLERSTCVDLDTPLPGSSFKRLVQLAPVSASPLVPEAAAGRDSPSDGRPSMSRNDGQPCEEMGHRADLADDRLQHRYVRHHSQRLQQPLERPIRRDISKKCPRAEDEASFRPLDTCNHQRSERMGAMFKSAPDIAGLLSTVGPVYATSSQPTSTGHVKCDTRDLADMSCGPWMNQSQQQGPIVFLPHSRTVPKRTSTRSSYAVPLCSGHSNQFNQRRHHQQQQPCFERGSSSSCPSSLRRKRKVGPPTLSSDLYAPSGHSLGRPSAGVIGACLCRHCADIVRNHDHRHLMRGYATRCHCLGNQSLARRNALHLLHCPDCNSILASGAQDQKQQLQGYHDHNNQQGWFMQPLQHLDDNDNINLPDRADQATRFPSSCLQQLKRPPSSQSNRSPLHYGLYESDYEDQEQEEEDDEMEGDEHDLDDYAMKKCPATSSSHLRWTEYCRDTFDRTPNSSIHFNSNAGEQTAVKPVEGYDQTMSRSSLKSRQRSRSQPPKISSMGANPDDEATYLCKSVENVEKLIKEVQLELDSLKKLPIGAATIGLNDMGAAIPGIGPASAKPKLTAKSAPGPPGDSAKMSIEEKLAEGRGQQDLATADRSTRLTTSATRRAGQFKCAGAIRKAGFLSVKKWILRRRQSIELARKQGWKRYWVCLRGTALLFHSLIDKTSEISDHDTSQRIDLLTWIDANCGSRMQMVTDLLKNESQQQDLGQDVFLNNIAQCYIEKEPKHLIIIDGAIAQPIPEHPKRDFVFCLSTTFGDAYLFQSSCQLEADNWISAIHNACAASIARDLTRDEATKLFETKIRHLELEAEKKLFLRQRLESRLTSMTSMSKTLASSETDDEICRKLAGSRQQTMEHQSGKKVTLRSLLNRLSQQLLALDTFSEQLHCEIYQLRCYLSSCGNQQLFYQNIQHQSSGASPASFATGNVTDLPHPKSLLMHVSKPTKLLLIKLGVFTVSSFHAYIHARQESAESIVQKLQQPQTCPSSPLELRIRSHSISHNLLGRTENIKLDNDTEELIELASLRSITIKLTRSLYAKIRGCGDGRRVDLAVEELEDTSDDRYSIRAEGDQTVVLNMRLQTNSTSTSIIKQLLKLIEPNLGEFEFLNYYLRLIVEPQVASAFSGPNNVNDSTATTTTTSQAGHHYHPIKRKETLADWNNFKHLELLEKKLFRVELNRSRLDEDASNPFGISLEGHLFIGRFESLLNVYCSYIEWGSVADRSGLRDEDEYVMINGIPVGDLDMMFVECLIKDASKLKIVVRSSRTDSPPSSVAIDQMRPAKADDDDDENEKDHEDNHEEAADYYELEKQYKQTEKSLGAGSSQIITDEHITSLVCPPPPAQSDAFLRTDPSLVRQKSDLIAQKHARDNRTSGPPAIPKSKSQHKLDNSPIGLDFDQASDPPEAPLANGDELAKQLIRKTERLTKLLVKEQTPEVVDMKEFTSGQQTCPPMGQKCDQALVERLKKSLLELLETEHAYIRHLETIVEHYMAPMKESSFLDINDLRLLHGSCLDLLTFQRNFFELLTSRMMSSCQLAPLTLQGSTGTAKATGTGVTDDYERLNRIINYINSLASLDQLTGILGCVSSVFLSEAEKFKNYADHCVAYSRLQRILHPKGVSGSKLPCSSIISIPSALNTFSSSTTNMIATTNANSSSQQPVKLMSSLLSATGNVTADLSSQLRRLTDFLANLDSSSSSLSLSLPRSSGSDQLQQQHGGNKHLETKAANISIDKSSTTPTTANQLDSSFQKSVHQQNFESYLIKPIQRIVKYPMLLSSIAMSLQQNTSDAYGELICAVRQMESIIGHVNDTQRIHDEYGHIFDHIERQYGEQQAQEAAKWTSSAAVSPSPSLCGPHQPPISLNIAQLLYFNSVEWLNMHEFSSKIKKGANLSQVLFVFNSCVVFICKEHVKPSGRKRIPLTSVGSQHSTSSLGCGANSSARNNNNILNANNNNQETHEIVRYQTLIPVKEVQVRSVALDSSKPSGHPKPGSTGHKFQWEMFQCSSSNSNSSLLTKSAGKRNNDGKMYLLASPSNEDRSAFLRKIRFIIRESVRNMSLPLARSPSSKSFASTKKMSTSSTDSASNTNTNSSCSASFSPESNLSRDLSHQVVGRLDVAAAAPPDNCAFNKSAKFENRIQVNN